MCYAGDPVAALHGTEERRRLLATIMFQVWEAICFGLACAKGQLAKEFTWIGDTIICEPWGVRASVKESIVSDLCDDLKRMLSRNIVTKKELHPFMGKLGHALGLRIIMRPFLEPLWVALASDETNGAPRNTIW